MLPPVRDLPGLAARRGPAIGAPAWSAAVRGPTALFRRVAAELRALCGEQACRVPGLRNGGRGSGPADAVGALSAALKQAGFAARECPVAGAGHFWFSEEPIEEQGSYVSYVATARALPAPAYLGQIRDRPLKRPPPGTTVVLRVRVPPQLPASSAGFFLARRVGVAN